MWKTYDSNNPYVSVHSQSNMPMFCLKKLISQPRVVEKSPFLAWRTLTHYILMSVIFRPHLTPPLCLKMTKCAIFSTFRESHFEHTPKVGVRREKFNIGNVAQIFLVASTYVGTKPFHFHNISPWKIFHRHPCPVHFFQNWQIWGKMCIKNRKIKILICFQLNSINFRSNNYKNICLHVNLIFHKKKSQPAKKLTPIYWVSTAKFY